MEKRLKISFCIPCKGRLEHLKQTLPENLKNSADYAHVEFVVLDYDSRDGLAQWMKENFAPEIASGKIRYAKFEGAPYFKVAHAKNMAHRIATGDVLCNLDADNIIAPGFASWLDKTFSKRQDCFVRVSRHAPHMNNLHNDITRHAGKLAMKAGSVMGVPLKKPPEWARENNLDGIHGRIAMTRQHYMQLHGYDEKYEGWGYDEDGDIKLRAQAAGLKHVSLPPGMFGTVLAHDDGMRIKELSPEQKDASQLLIEARQRFTRKSWPGKARHFLGKAAGTNKWMPEPAELANPSGNFGCGDVRLNFSGDIVTLSPVVNFPEPHYDAARKPHTIPSFSR